MSVAAAWHLKTVAAVMAPTVALLVAAGTLWINGERSELQRRRKLYARGLAAALAYTEMPFQIRRRRCEDEHRSAELVRLATRFSEIQAELAVCESLIAGEDRALAQSFASYVDAVRATAGGAARDSWNAPPIAHDREVNLPDVADALIPLAGPRAAYVAQIARATRSTWCQFREAIAAPPTF